MNFNLLNKIPHVQVSDAETSSAQAPQTMPPALQLVTKNHLLKNSRITLNNNCGSSTCGL
jgi:hypothetical protein